MSKKWTALVYVVLVFGAGVVAGSLGTNLYNGSAVAAKTAAAPSPTEWRQKYVGELQTRLKMSDTQLAQLHQILDQTRDKYRAARERAKPEMAKIHSEQIAGITALLTAEQRPEYERIVEEHERQRKLRDAGAKR